MMLLLSCRLLAQDSIYTKGKYQFIAYEAIPAWTGVASGWHTSSPAIHLYDGQKYKGHAEFVSRGLKTGITFKQFKENVMQYNGRKYVPFFLYDLRKNPLTIEGRKYTWAVRLEDYGYTDSQQQMEETVIQLMKQLSAFTKQKGMLILATSNAVKPNSIVKEQAEKQGIQTLTLSKLIEHAKGSKTKVLNPGKATGYLRFIRADCTQVYLKATDIVIYEKLPLRVPPVAGIITLEPQTPLSHVNLLARNRGTINLYTTGMEMLPGAEAFINKPVTVDCTGDEVSFASASKEEVIKFNAGKKNKVVIPDPALSNPGIIQLGIINSSSRPHEINTNLIGAKANNYHRLQSAFPAYVRPGYAIPFYYYFDVLERSGADALVNDLMKIKDTASIYTIDERLHHIRDKIENSDADTALIGNLHGLINKNFPNSRIRLRSSTNCEDLPNFNGAGLYLSKGSDAGESKRKLEQKLLDVYASLWTQHAFEEREFYNIDHTKAGMAVLINESYKDEFANGVVLTVPGKDDFSIIINSQPGDALVTNPENGEIPEAIVFPASGADAFTVESSSNIGSVFLAEGMKAKLLELKKVSADIHRHFTKDVAGDYGVDIEFKLVKEKNGTKLYIKQARLIGSVMPG